MVKEIPFIDDWTEADYEEQIQNLKHTVRSEGLVYGAFLNQKLKGFVSVEMELFGGALFWKARQWARERGTEKLYISAHSAIESQAFYRKMGCVEAQEYDQAHVEKEPCDCQLECGLSSD